MPPGGCDSSVKNVILGLVQLCASAKILGFVGLLGPDKIYQDCWKTTEQYFLIHGG
jgi:hypothetical protein